MKEELEQLVKLAGTAKFETALNSAYKKYKDDKEAKSLLSELLNKELDSTRKNLNHLENEISIKMKMEQVSEIISLSYIARTYFNKSRHWLYHRINNSVINGKVQQFKEDELKTLNYALADISKKIGSLSI